MPGLYSHTTRSDGTTLTASIYNTDHQNHIDNHEPQQMDDYSSTVAQMKTTMDPGEDGTESQPTTLAGELERLRFAIKEAKSASQWYESPNNFKSHVDLLRGAGQMESWSAGASAAPDGWTLTGAGASVARDATNVRVGTYSASLTRVGANAYLHHDAENQSGGTNYIQGRTFTFGAWVRATVASSVNISINDGITDTDSAYHSGGSGWEFLTVTKTLAGTATVLRARCNITTTDTTAQFDGAVLVEGSFAPTSLSGFEWQVPRITNFQNEIPTNFADQGAWRIEIGDTDIAGNIAAAAVTKAVTFETAFRIARVVVLGSRADVGGEPTLWLAQSLSATGFTMRAETADGTNFNNTSVGACQWVAIGQV